MLQRQNDEIKAMNLAESYSLSQDYVLTKQKLQVLQQEFEAYEGDSKKVVGLEVKIELLEEQIKEFKQKEVNRKYEAEYKQKVE